MSTLPFGLIASLSQSRITLPLVHLETRFRITGGVAAVEMDQVFEQTARESLDVTYTFPLPGTASVYRCEMIVNGRCIRAIVMDAREAWLLVAEKKAAGHRTALVEMERDNLFTLQLGNVAPGDSILIRFAYFETLERLGSRLSLRIPFNPGVRYIPGRPLLRQNRGRGAVDDTDQVPDASRLTPPRISATHPDAATIYLQGSLDAAEVDLRTLGSPTHPAVIRPADAFLEVELAGEQHVPDRDFVLAWEESAAAAPLPRVWITREEAGPDYALVQIRAPQAEALVASDALAQDFYFLLDRSGSMNGGNWEQASRALHAFVRQLGGRDRVWITCFESAYQDFAEVPLLRDELLADHGFQNLSRIGTRGGTELLPALEHVLDIRERHRSGNPARLIVITDGQVANETEILRRMREPDAADIPVHCFGIDRAVNDYFLKALARRSGGRCVLMTPDDDIPAAVERLAVTLRRPVLTGIRLEGGALGPGEDKGIPDLHAGEVALVPVRRDAGRSVDFHLTARLPDGSPWEQRVPLTEAIDAEAPRLLWARERLVDLLESGRDKEAIQLAIAYNITCPGASFVAWDDAEKVPVAHRDVYQPSIDMVCEDADAPHAASHSLYKDRVSNYQKSSRLGKTLAEDMAQAAPSPLPSRVPNLLSRLFGRPARVESATLPDDGDGGDGRLARWAHRFARLLVERLKLPQAVAHEIASTLRAWAVGHISTRRDALLESWLAELENAGDLPVRLRELLAPHQADQPVKAALALLDAALGRASGRGS